MSRIGKKLIPIPVGVTVNFDPKTLLLKIKGPLGELSQDIHPFINFSYENNEIEVKIKNETEKKQKAIWGTTRAIVANMVDGVTKGFEKQIELNGVGYKMELAGQNLTLYIGFSHLVKLDVPTGIKLTLNKNMLSGTCNDKQQIGNFFASIFRLKPCDVYKHKGFKFPGVFYRKKVVKKSK